MEFTHREARRFPVAYVKAVTVSVRRKEDLVIISSNQRGKLRINIDVGSTILKKSLAEVLKVAFGAFKYIELAVRTVRMSPDVAPQPTCSLKPLGCR